MPLASSTLPKREVWKCVKSSPLTNLFSMLIDVARFRAEPRESQSVPFSGLFAIFCACGSKREIVMESQKYCEQKSVKFGGNMAF